MHTTTYRYDPYRKQVRKDGTCPVCGKRVVRSQTFEETHNPFNKNPDGTVKTPEQIMDSLRTKAEAWEPDFRHAACK